jgi:hypothetical protein
MKKIVSRQIVKNLKKENKRLLKLIHLKCAECNGYYVDGFSLCGSESCPLRFTQPKRGFLNTKECQKGPKEEFSH